MTAHPAAPEKAPRRTRAFAILGMILLVLALGARSTYLALSGAPVFRIRNNSAAALTDLSLAGTGWEKRIDRIEPASGVEFVQHVRGEADFGLAFTADGKKRSAEGAYFEGAGGYCIDIIIETDYSVRVEVRVACFSMKRAA